MQPDLDFGDLPRPQTQPPIHFDLVNCHYNSTSLCLKSRGISAHCAQAGSFPTRYVFRTPTPTRGFRDHMSIMTSSSITLLSPRTSLISCDILYILYIRECFYIVFWRHPDLQPPTYMVHPDLFLLHISPYNGFGVVGARQRVHQQDVSPSLSTCTTTSIPSFNRNSRTRSRTSSIAAPLAAVMCTMPNNRSPASAPPRSSIQNLGTE